MTRKIPPSLITDTGIVSRRPTEDGRHAYSVDWQAGVRPPAGRRPKYPWPEMSTALVAYVALHGLPEKQADLERLIEEIFVRLCGDHPQISMIREFAAKTFAEHRAQGR
jgi:hypothetical protein